MLKKSLKNIPTFIAGDKTIIQEFIHPKNDGVDVQYSLAHAIVEVGKSSEPHILHQSSELYVILEGESVLHVGEEAEILIHIEALLHPRKIGLHVFRAPRGIVGELRDLIPIMIIRADHDHRVMRGAAADARTPRVEDAAFALFSHR